MLNKDYWLHLNSNRWNSAITGYAVASVRSLVDEHLEEPQVVYGLEDKPFLKRLHKEVTNQDKLFLRSTKFGFLAFYSLLFLGRPKAIVVYQGKETVMIQMLRFLGFYRKVPFFRFYGSANQRNDLFLARIFVSLFGFLKPHPIYPTATMQKRLETKGKGSLLPMAIDTHRFYFDPQSYKASDLNLLVFGRFDPVKGHREFLELFARYLQTNKQKPKLYLIGKEANLSKQELQISIDRLGLGAWVEVYDSYIDNPHLLFSKTTLGVVPSLDSEVICRVSQEFLCCGTPVVVSSAGSLPDYVDANHVFDLDGVSGLSKAIETAMKEDVATRVSRSKHFSELYSLHQMGKGMADLLHDALRS